MTLRQLAHTALLVGSKCRRSKCNPLIVVLETT